MQSTLFEAEQLQDNSFFKSLLLKYFSYWRLFAVLLISGGIMAFLYLQFKIPVYKIKATIIIKDEQKGIDDARIIQSLNAFSSTKIVENEIEVIKSYTLAEEVVKNLYLYAPVNEKRSVSDRSAYTTSPIRIIAKYPDSLEAANKVYFIYDAGKQQVIVDNTAYSLSQWTKSPYGELMFIPNPNYRPSGIASPMYFSLKPVSYVASDLTEALNVSASNKLSTVINISLTDEVPAEGKAVLNELIAAYNRSAIADKNTLASNTLAFVDERLRYITHDLDSIETNLQQFKTKNNVVDIDAQGKQFLQSVGQNDQQIGNINMQLAILDQIENYVLGKDGKGGIVPSTFGITDSELSGLLEKLYNAELEYEKLRKIAPENNPMLISITDQINKIRPSVLENIQSQRKSLTAGRNNLTITNNKYSSMLGSIPNKERQLLEISRQQSVKSDIYNFLLQKREEAAISYASTVSNNRLVDGAISSKSPVSPNKIVVYLVAIIMSVVVGLAYIELKDILNNNISSLAEVEKYTSIPIVGEIVKANIKNPIVVGESSPSLIAEEFRQLRTGLSYLGINSRKNRLLITSSISGEGKSFVSVNLAISLALTNKKVVLIDLDLRKPSLAAILDVPNTEGVSEYLKGEREIEAIIKRTNYGTNLFFIPSGPITTNPSELLLNGKIDELFAYLQALFDYVVIDTAPVNPVTDASILSPLCDATLYVIREAVTPKMFVQKLDKYSRIKVLKNVAIILNGAQGGTLGKYNGSYSYGHDYLKRRKSKRKVNN